MSIDKLKEHPKNNHYFTDIEGAKYDEVKKSIEINGIRDPIKCTTAYTVISGHQRLRIARELGFTEVPVSIVDVDEWEAEYLLIAENTERRGQAESDPIKKSNIAKFMEDWWERQGLYFRGRGNRHNAELKTQADVAEFIGEDVRTTKRLLKLNDLIPEIQQLVSSGKLGTTAAEQYAYITEDNQRVLINALGENLGSKTVVESKDIRKQAERDDFAKLLKESEDENKRLSVQLQKERSKPVQVETKIIEKEVDKTDYNAIKNAKEESLRLQNILERKQSEINLLETRLVQEEFDADAHRKLEEDMRMLKSQHGDMHRRFEAAREIGELLSDAEEYFMSRFAGLKFSKLLKEADNSIVIEEGLDEFEEMVETWLRDLRFSRNRSSNYTGEIIEATIIESGGDRV